MGRLKTYAGLGILIQAIAFLCAVLFSSAKRKRTLVCGMLAACLGTLGTYLVLNGARDTAPTLDIGDPEDIFGAEEVPEINCYILKDGET